MKKTILFSSIIVALATVSCKKYYVCECKHPDGSKTYGDTFKSGPAEKAAADIACTESGKLDNSNCALITQ